MQLKVTKWSVKSKTVREELSEKLLECVWVFEREISIFYLQKKLVSKVFERDNIFFGKSALSPKVFNPQVLSSFIKAAIVVFIFIQKTIQMER